MAQKTILIIDAEKILVDLLTHALSSSDLATLGSTSVTSGEQLLKLYSPDIVLIDGAIPNGLALIAALSGSEQPQVLALYASPDVESQLRSMGVEHRIDRNGGMEALLPAVEALLGGSRQTMGREDGSRVLIVDDEEDIRDTLGRFLASKGYHVTTARNGKEGIESVANDPKLDVVLLDVRMPGVGGIDALEQIMDRSDPPRVLMMTAVADRDVARQALRLGAFDYVLKPFEFAAIESTIAAGLSHLEYQRQPWWKRLGRG